MTISTTAATATCPTWCRVDHASEEAYDRGVASAHGLPYLPDPRGPLHRSDDIKVGQHDADDGTGWAFAQLVQDEGVTRVYLNDEEVTLEVAEGLADALRALVAIGRQS
ncbi:MAG: hypothetical protein U0R80_08030 [Nocardioidaceae bacterium]